MPILWRYTLRHYFSVFFLIAGSFLTLLFVSRMRYIAQFAALGGGFSQTLYFLLLQMPHILPFAIPTASFFSAFVLFQKMSQSNELTAFRSSGIELKTILHPILIASLCLSICNLYLCSEVTTKAKHQTRKLYTDKTSQNPLFLLKKQNLSSLHGYYLRFDDLSEGMDNLFIIGKNPYHHSLFLFSANRLSYKEDQLEGENISSLSFFSKPSGFDTLYLENGEKIHSLAPTLTTQLKKNKYRLNPSSLPIAHLQIKKKSQKVFIRELIRRISLGISPFSCTLLGISYGIEISRRKKKKIGQAFFFCALLLASYMVGKHLKNYFWLASLLFLFPHLLIYMISWRNYRKIVRGCS